MAYLAGPGAKKTRCHGPVPMRLAGFFRSSLHVKKFLSLVALVLTFLQTGLSARAQAGKALPLPRIVVVSIGKFMRAWWWAVWAWKPFPLP
jgi:hypothetical protein